MKSINKENEYFLWLYEKISDVPSDDSYWLLAKTLHKVPFYWSVANDDNRLEDGLHLREQFDDEFGYYSDAIKPGETCTMLEMLIALAERCEYMMEDGDNTPPASKWFWEMIHNVGLDEFTDDQYFESRGRNSIAEILHHILDRDYKRNGEGGLFPLKRPREDQRKVEIWYQMAAYLLENYYIEERV